MFIVIAFLLHLFSSPIYTTISSPKIVVKAGVLPTSSQEIKMKSHTLVCASHTLTLHGSEANSMQHIAWHQIESVRIVEGTQKFKFLNSKKKYLVIYTPTVNWVISFKTLQDLDWFTALLHTHYIEVGI